MTEKQKVLMSVRVLFAFDMKAEARKLWNEWKRSTEYVNAPTQVVSERDAERRHREEMAF